MVSFSHQYFVGRVKEGAKPPLQNPSPSPYKERGIKGVRLLIGKCSTSFCHPE